MQAKVGSKVAPTRDYQDYAPATELVEEEDCDTLLIYLPGFKKEQVRVQLTPTPTLKISGERHIGDNKWSRFHKEYPVSTKCETDKITAKFDVGILYIRQPKSITPVVEKEGEKPEAQKPQKNENELPLPQTTEMKKASKMKHETKSGQKMEDEDKNALKSEEAYSSDVTQKSREEEQKKGGVENDVTGKRKRVDEFQTEDFMTSRVKMAKKVGRMMSVAVVVLSAIVLGIYVKNLVMPAGDYEN